MQRDERNSLNQPVLTAIGHVSSPCGKYFSPFRTMELTASLIIISHKYSMNATFYGAFALKSGF